MLMDHCEPYSELHPTLQITLYIYSQLLTSSLFQWTLQKHVTKYTLEQPKIDLESYRLTSILVLSMPFNLVLFKLLIFL